MTGALDNQRPPRERSPALEAAIRQLLTDIHDMLDGPDGSMEMQRVTLTLPRAFVDLAAFLAVVDEKEDYPLSFWDYVTTTPDDGTAARQLTRKRNAYLEARLNDAMHLSLHLLATDALELQGQRGL